MKGFKVSFNIFAESQEEADMLSSELGKFIDNNAKQGIAITANKAIEAIKRWGNNFLVNSYFRK